MTSVQPTPSIETEAVDRFFDRVVACDVPEAQETLGLVATLLDPSEFVFGFILPTVRRLGVASYDGSISRAIEQLGVNLIRAGILKYPVNKVRDLSTRMVLATPSLQYHEIGLLAAAVLARTEGFRISYLGTNLPLDQIREVADRGRADIVLLAVLAEDGDYSLEWAPGGAKLWIGTRPDHPIVTAPPTAAKVVTSFEALRNEMRNHVEPDKVGPS